MTVFFYRDRAMALSTCCSSVLALFFLVAYLRSMDCTLFSETATDNIDEIFDNISEDLSETRLRHFLHRTDLNMDGKISSDELKAWVASIRHDHAVRMSEERLAEYDSNNDGVVSMKEYFDAIYGNNQNLDDTKETRDKLEQSKYQDKIRWKYADFNGDGSLSLEELAAFENPENYETMKEYNVEATFQGLDVDNDGKISLMEYLGSDVSIYVAADEVNFRERFFKQLKDRDQDGYLDMAEVKKWIRRSYPSRVELEAKGFMRKMDRNKNGILNKDEVLNNWDEFSKKYPELKNILVEHTEL